MFIFIIFKRKLILNFFFITCLKKCDYRSTLKIHVLKERGPKRHVNMKKIVFFSWQYYINQDKRVYYLPIKLGQILFLCVDWFIVEYINAE